MSAVEWKSFEELGFFYGGLSGKNKDDFQDGNAKFVTYMNIFSNPSLNLNIEDRVKVGIDEKQNTVQYGDVLFTGSSETPEECGMSSVVTEHINEPIYLNSFCFGYRLNDSIIFEPNFLKHYLRCEAMRKAIATTASGVTRFNVSKKRLNRLLLPIPSLAKQQEIVSHLDAFTTLISSLESELEMRRKQYEHYRNQLLDFEGVEGVEWKTLEELSLDIFSGATPSTKQSKYWQDGTIPWMSSGEVHQGIVETIEKRITQEGYDSCSTQMVPLDSIVIALAGQGKTRGCVALTKTELCTNQSLAAIVPNKILLNSEYLYYYLKSKYMELRTISAGDGTRGGLNLQMIRNYKIILPSLHEQEIIVNKLNSFANLIQSLEQEIKLRKQQYEYYREKLLTFEKE